MALWKALRWSVIFIFISIVLSSPSLDYFQKSGCNFHQTSQDFDADFVVGALFPIHELDYSQTKYVLNVYGVTWVEAFLFAIDEINQNKTLLPGVKLGYDIRDTCNSQQVAKIHALDFMSNKKYFRTTGHASQFTGCKCYDEKQTKLIGVVGKCTKFDVA